jgi:hypothetical protein
MSGSSTSMACSRSWKRTSTPNNSDSSDSSRSDSSAGRSDAPPGTCHRWCESMTAQSSGIGVCTAPKTTTTCGSLPARGRAGSPGSRGPRGACPAASFLSRTARRAAASVPIASPAISPLKSQPACGTMAPRQLGFSAVFSFARTNCLAADVQRASSAG